MIDIEYVDTETGTLRRVRTSQIVLRATNGTVLGYAAKFGSDGAIAVGHCKDIDFNSRLSELGLSETTTVTAWRP